MIDPATSLVVFALILIILVIIFWPEKGIIARWRWSKNASRKVLMEDALKHIYKCELENITCTFTSLAGALSKDTNQVTPILDKLQSMDLLTIDNQGFQLTPDGKDYALRIIRIHRLWERYLAEETGVPETAWHAQADIKEHEFSIEEANRISRQLGYPRYDPHGDPIPTAAGDLPLDQGRRLTDFEEKDIVRVKEIEDEPPTVYAEIIKKGVHLGVHIEIVKKNRSGIQVKIAGKPETIPSLLVSNITAVHAAEEKKKIESYAPLSSLKTGDRAEVIGISRACRGAQRRRLMDLGIVPGTLISMEMISAGGDPKAYNIRGAIIALRDEQASFVHIQKAKQVV